MQSVLKDYASQVNNVTLLNPHYQDSEHSQGRYSTLNYSPRYNGDTNAAMKVT